MARRPNTKIPSQTIVGDRPISVSAISEVDARGLVDVARGVRVVLSGPAVRPHRVERPIASTIEEARSKGYDYWDPHFNNGQGSWIRGGVKAERDYTENYGNDFIDYLDPSYQPPTLFNEPTTKDGIN